MCFAIASSNIKTDPSDLQDQTFYNCMCHVFLCRIVYSLRYVKKKTASRLNAIATLLEDALLPSLPFFKYIVSFLHVLLFFYYDATHRALFFIWFVNLDWIPYSITL